MTPNTILLVDDDDTTNLLNKYFAEAINATIDVVTTGNGIEALKFLEESDIKVVGPCFVVLDIFMPLMDGREFLIELENRFEDSFTENVIVIILTTDRSDDLVESFMKFNQVKDVIEKPLSELKFKALINKHYNAN